VFVIFQKSMNDLDIFVQKYEYNRRIRDYLHKSKVNCLKGTSKLLGI